jgi:small conductance mechanosensitive channel
MARTRRSTRDRLRPRLERQLAHTAALRRQATERARRARLELLVLLPLVTIVVLAYYYRREVFGVDAPVRVVTVVALVILGWELARAVGRAMAPSLLGRLDPGTAAVVSFLVRLITLAAALAIALRIAGLRPDTLAVGGVLTAVILGLAAQQTLGNLIAGTVLLSARPFRIGERVRLQAGGLAGDLEGVVTSLGLLYTTFSRGSDLMLVPNSIVLNAAVLPLREPAPVDLRARLRPGIKPSEVQALLDEQVKTPTRSEPHIALEEVDADEVVVRITATPEFHSDGPYLADEILAVVSLVTSGRRVDAD